jgi:hypothetical protein
MTTNTRLAVLIYSMVQAVLFGVPTIIVLSVPSLAADAAAYLPWIIVLSFLVAVPVALIVGPWMRARRELRNLPPAEAADTPTDLGLSQGAAPRRVGSFPRPAPRPAPPAENGQTRRSL